MKKLVIIGASGHGKVIADIAVKNGYEEIAFLDDDETILECAGFPVIGKTTDFVNYPDCDFCVGIGNASIRKMMYDRLTEYKIATLIHPNAIISRRVQIGIGTVIMAGAIVNSDAVIGRGCIVNTGASIDHDCRIGDYVHIAVGAHVAGNVAIGGNTWVGIGTAIKNNLNICGDCTIGAGAVVVKNIEESGTYVGCPAIKMK